ncbi:hypothetical protein [Pseudofrankia asymbiotica]|uniref:Uncharacterized protein n=1 Tax=Pseudofrankia asymbiotica TaxID=1834516 RepID=A0A1V2IES4_9ACTN|nr:hypothetical protein [Pseudofrankia asymbiotica]ONH31617.1 hypothetical protein BL253_08010 [Pseudofrankia asymbiotica]
MIMHCASQTDIDAMADNETAAGPAWTSEESRDGRVHGQAEEDGSETSLDHASTSEMDQDIGRCDSASRDGGEGASRTFAGVMIGVAVEAGSPETDRSCPVHRTSEANVAFPDDVRTDGHGSVLLVVGMTVSDRR